MTTLMPAPRPDPLVEALFSDLLEPPPGYSYYPPGQILFPVHGQDKWRLLLRKDGTEELTPIFLEGAFILKLTKALNAMQRELNAAVSDEIPEPVKHAAN